MSNHPAPLSPPRFAEKLLTRLYPDKGAYSTAGDMREEFQRLAEEEGTGRARSWYRRHMKRQKIYSVINIGGLAISMACALLIVLWVRDELSFDKFNANKNEIYRVAAVGKTDAGFSSPAPFAPAGAFPSFYLSSFQPAQIFRGRSSGWVKKGSLRRILVVAQFSISITLILATVVVLNQMNFIREKSWNSGQDTMLYIPFKENIGSKYDLVRSKLLEHPSISAVGAALLLSWLTVGLQTLRSARTNPVDSLRYE